MSIAQSGGPVSRSDSCSLFCYEPSLQVRKRQLNVIEVASCVVQVWYGLMTVPKTPRTHLPF